VRTVGLCFQRGGAIVHVAMQSTTSFGTCFLGRIILQFCGKEYIGQYVLRTLQPQNLPYGWILILKSLLSLRLTEELEVRVTEGNGTHNFV